MVWMKNVSYTISLNVKISDLLTSPPDRNVWAGTATEIYAFCTKWHLHRNAKITTTITGPTCSAFTEKFRTIDACFKFVTNRVANFAATCIQYRHIHLAYTCVRTGVECQSESHYFCGFV